MAFLCLPFAIGFVQAEANPDPSPHYPVTIQQDAGTVVIHHPVVTDWHEFTVLSAWVPVEVSLNDSSGRWMGSVKAEADTEIRSDDRLVILTNLRLIDGKAAEGLSPEGMALQNAPEARKLVQDALSLKSRSISLEYLLRSLPDDFAKSQLSQSGPGLNPRPPRIIVSNRPAQLMLIDGPPSKTPIDGVGLEYVVNSNWDIFYHVARQRWYVINGQTWLENSQLAGGDWFVTTELPEDFNTLALSSGGEGLRQIIPPRAPESVPPPITISYEPAELVVMDGKPVIKTVAGDLNQVTNTDSDLFELNGTYYLLLSGRWFKTGNLKRGWATVKNLPAEFAAIPPDHPRGYVRVAVPGTEEARVALIEAILPRTTEREMSAGGELEVSYTGKPDFVPVQGTRLFRADNSPYQVLRHNNFYYLCLEGAWYRSDSPNGPWKAAVKVPEEIYAIPPSDPAYNVTFVRVDAFDDSSGKVAYKSSNGYLGTYTAGPTVVHGTGYYHNGANYRYRGYSSYYYHPYSYGYGAWYHPAYGRYGYRRYYDPLGYPYPVNTSVTVSVPEKEKDFQWDAEGKSRPIYGDGSRNYIGSGTYQLNGSKPLQTKPPDNDAPVRRDQLFAAENGTLYRLQGQQWQVYSSGWNNVSQAPPEVRRQAAARESGYQIYERYRQQESAVE